MNAPGSSGIAEQLQASCAALDVALVSLQTSARKVAETERVYRVARANAYLGTSGTVAEREASTNKVVAQEAYEAHLAEGLHKAALENVRAKRAQLSAIQTLASLSKEEAAFARTGP